MLYSILCLSMKFSSIGDCCVDRYIKEKKSFLGGGAFNVASFARQFGLDTHLISSIGTDTYADAYKEYSKKVGIDSTYLTIHKGSTSTIDITLTDHSPEYGEWKLGALERRRLTRVEKKF